MPRTIRTLVFDDEVSMCNHLRNLLVAAPNIDLVGEITEMCQLLPQCLALQPDVLLIGGKLKPFIFDIPAVILQDAPNLKIIALLNQADAVRMDALLAAHPSACLFRHEIDQHLVHTIHSVARGTISFSHSVFEQIVTRQQVNDRPTESQAQVTLSQLTRREQELLHLLTQGLSNKEMARALTLSEKTIAFHLNNLFTKLQVTSRTAAALWAKEHKLFSDR